MNVLKKIGEAVDRVCGVLIVLMVGAMVIITTAQIIWRVGSGTIPGMRPLSWSEEVTRFLLIWATFLGATCVYLHGGNISITFIQEAFGPKTAKVLQALVHAVCLILFVVLCWYGARYAMNLKKTATTLPIKMSAVFIVIPVSMAICAFHALVLLLEKVFGKDPEKEVDA